MAFSLQLTAHGKAAIAAAITGGGGVSFAKIALSAESVEGVNVVDVPEDAHTFDVATVAVSTEGNVVIRAIIPPDAGGYYVRSVFVLDTARRALAFAEFPMTYKPASASDNASAQWDFSFALQIGADAAPAIVTPNFADWLAELLANAGGGGGSGGTPQNIRAAAAPVPVNMKRFTVTFSPAFAAGSVPAVAASVRTPSGGDSIFATVENVTAAGFTVALSSFADEGGYSLNFIAIAP